MSCLRTPLMRDKIAVPSGLSCVITLIPSTYFHFILKSCTRSSRCCDSSSLRGSVSIVKKAYLRSRFTHSQRFIINHPQGPELDPQLSCKLWRTGSHTGRVLAAHSSRPLRRATILLFVLFLAEPRQAELCGLAGQRSLEYKDPGVSFHRW